MQGLVSKNVIDVFHFKTLLHVYPPYISLIKVIFINKLSVVQNTLMRAEQQAATEPIQFSKAEFCILSFGIVLLVIVHWRGT